jgi:hypothetical protein
VRTQMHTTPHQNTTKTPMNTEKGTRTRERREREREQDRELSKNKWQNNTCFASTKKKKKKAP